MKTKTNTKYATYTQNQRLGMIKNGNEDVYSAEKDNNRRLKELRENLGLPTEDIDAWDKVIDEAVGAVKKSMAPLLSSKGNETAVPRFQSSRVGAISGQYNNYMQNLARTNNAKQKQAKEQARKDIDYLIEYLVNNGYSSDGKMAREGEEEIQSELKTLLDSLQREYLEAKHKAKEKYIAQVDKTRPEKK